jgi:hypothetical protein
MESGDVDDILLGRLAAQGLVKEISGLGVQEK